MTSMELQEAVGVCFSGVAEKKFAVCTIPDGGASFLVVIVAVVASVHLIVTSYWEVGLAESLWNWCGRGTAWPFPATISTNQLLRQSGPEHLGGVDVQVSMQQTKNVAVCDGDIQQKPENVLVIFSAFQSHVIVSPKMVIIVNPSHVLVVLCNRRGTCVRLSRTILLFTGDSVTAGGV